MSVPAADSVVWLVVAFFGIGAALLALIGLLLPVPREDDGGDQEAELVEAREHLRDSNVVPLRRARCGTTEAGSPARSWPASARLGARGDGRSLWEA